MMPPVVKSRKRRVTAVTRSNQPSSPLKQHAQIITEHRQAQRRLGAPKLGQSQLRQSKVCVQLFDHFLTARPAIVLVLQRNGTLAPWQAGPQRLIEIARTIHQFGVASCHHLADPFAIQENINHRDRPTQIIAPSLRRPPPPIV